MAPREDVAAVPVWAILLTLIVVMLVGVLIGRALARPDPPACQECRCQS